MDRLLGVFLVVPLGIIVIIAVSVAVSYLESRGGNGNEKTKSGGEEKSGEG